MATQAVCKEPDCGKGGKLRRGWCKKHYWRWSKFGSPNPDGLRQVRGPGLCSLDGCDRTGKLTRGLCNLHYLRSLRGRTEDVRPHDVCRKYMLEHMWDECPKWPFTRSPQGYGHIGGSGHQGSRLVHRLVCEIVHGPPPSDKHQAAHECGNGRDGCFGARCLSWKTVAENAADMVRHGRSIRGEKHHNHRLTKVEVMAISALRPVPSTGDGASEVAKEYGVAPQTIADIWTGRTWGWLTGR